MLKTKYKLSGRPVFTFSLPGGNSPLCSCQLRHWLWHIVFTCSKLSILNCNNIRAGGIAGLWEGLHVVYIIYVLVELILGWKGGIALTLIQGFFKENVRYPVWIYRDQIYLILGTRYSLILGTR